MKKHILCLLIFGVLPGCIVSRSASSGKSSASDDSSASYSVDLGAIYGLVGMAVDGDDKDDYEKFLNDDDDCRRKR